MQTALVPTTSIEQIPGSSLNQSILPFSLSNGILATVYISLKHPSLLVMGIVAHTIGRTQEKNKVD